VDKPVKIRCVKSGCCGLIKDKIYKAWLYDISIIYIIDLQLYFYINNIDIELVEEEEKKMIREDFIKLLEYNDVKVMENCVYYSYIEPTQFYEFKKDSYHYLINVFNASLFKVSNNTCNIVFMATSYEDFIEFAKLKDIEFKAVPPFRPHWKITINGKETGKIIYADDVGINKEFNYYELISYLKVDKIMVSFNSEMYKNYECYFAYYKNNVLHEAVWIGEEKLLLV